MKKVLSALYTALCHFALAFSGIIIFFWLCFPTQTSYIDHSNLSVFCRFALVFGISSILFALPKKFPYAIKVVIHFIVNTVAFVFTFGMVNGFNQMRAFITAIIFVIIYVVIFGIRAVFGAIAKKLEKAED